MVFESIQALLIMDKGGISLFFMRLDPKSAEPRPKSNFWRLYSNYAFSEKAVSNNSISFVLDYGARLSRVISGNETNLIAVTIGKIQENLISVLSALSNEFEVRTSY